MKRKNTAQKLFLAIYRYVLFFLLAAFIITSCMLLFLNTMAREMDVSFTGEDIRHAALLTFANVFLLFCPAMLTFFSNKVSINIRKENAHHWEDCFYEKSSSIIKFD